MTGVTSGVEEPGLHNSWSDGCGNITTPSLDPLHFSLLTDMQTHVTVTGGSPGQGACVFGSVQGWGDLGSVCE